MSEWACVNGFCGKYIVYRTGKIKNVVTGHVLTPSVDKRGYYFVKLDRENLTRKNMFVHRIVAESFIPNPERKTQVNHKDGDKSNNCVENLEWATPAENIRHSYTVLGRSGSLKGKSGKLNANSIPVYQYGLDGQFIKSWDSVSDAARAIKCNPSQIINQISGRTITCHGYLWSYKKCEYIDNSKVIFKKTHKVKME